MSVTAICFQHWVRGIRHSSGCSIICSWNILRQRCATCEFLPNLAGGGCLSTWRINTQSLVSLHRGIPQLGNISDKAHSAYFKLAAKHQHCPVLDSTRNTVRNNNSERLKPLHMPMQDSHVARSFDSFFSACALQLFCMMFVFVPRRLWIDKFWLWMQTLSQAQGQAACTDRVLRLKQYVCKQQGCKDFLQPCYVNIVFDADSRLFSLSTQLHGWTDYTTTHSVIAKQLG